MDRFVIVGYDETLAAERALVVAANEAALRKIGLEVVNVFPALRDARSSSAAREAAEWITAQGARTAHQLHPDVPVETRALPGAPDKVLAEQTGDAELLVLGDRKHHGFTTLEEGAVTAHTLDKASCPVLVLSPENHRELRRMTVAVDLDEPLEELLGFAFSEASRRGAELSAVNVWKHHVVMDYDAFFEDEFAADASITADREEGLLAALEPWKIRYPDVECTYTVRTGSIGNALIDASKDTDLLIVGGRRHGGGEAGIEIGPTVHILLHHAECPLAVVPID